MRKTQEQYNSMELYDLFDAMQTADCYEMRKIHKALKKYGDGVPLMYRYPDFPAYFSVVSLVLVLLSLVVKLLVF